MFTIIIIISGNAQNTQNIDPTPKTPNTAQFQIQQIENLLNPENQIPIIPTSPFLRQDLSIQEQNRLLIEQTTQNELKRDQQIKEIYAEMKSEKVSYTLPGFNTVTETNFFHSAFDSISAMNVADFSLKKGTFLVENAYYENRKNYDDFQKIVANIGSFLLEKMNDLGYDKNSNVAKNFILFQFFSDTLQVKSGLEHFPVQYDFDDFMGDEDWSNMFVQKLLETNKGQCNSMPRLYLILAKEIDAEAFLSTSPNHSYIKFRDENNYWYNVELTNHMFTTNSAILQSGFIKAEALQNQIYMKNLTQAELKSQTLVDLAMAYIHKFGYDEFVNSVVDKALEISPNYLNALMIKANVIALRFEFVMKQIGINPRDNTDLQNIKYYPKAIAQLKNVNEINYKIDSLGYEFMSSEDYLKWLNSLTKAQEKQQSQDLKKQFQINLKPFKD